VIERFTQRGFDAVAFDSRAHGESDGDTCTYGFFEKQDLHRILDAAGPGPIILIGASLGGAIALQEPARDARVTAVVAAETLRTFDDVSPVAAAADIRIPVLLIHGADDSDTPPDHSRRVLAALKGPKRLILVPGGRHNQSLTGEVWNEVERWVDEIVGPR